MIRTLGIPPQFYRHFSKFLREKCPRSELFWSVFSRIRAECGEIRSISPYSVRKRENADQNNSEGGHFFTQCLALLANFSFLGF